MRTYLGFAAIAVLCVFALASCGGVTPIQELDAPKWVKKGSGAFQDEKGKAFYGVGSAVNISNPSLLRTTAQNRARDEVAKIFETYTKSLMKDYMASTSNMEPGVSSEEQHVEQAIRTMTDSTLSGVEIIDTWQNPSTGELFALARIDLKSFGDNLEKSKELNETTKKVIKENADKLHNELLSTGK